MLPDPVVLFFLLGLFARLVRSDLRVPEPLYEALSLYLLIAIGLKGGIELARHPLAALLPQVLGIAALGVVTTLVAFAVLRGLARLARPDGSDRSPSIPPILASNVRAASPSSSRRAGEEKT